MLLSNDFFFLVATGVKWTTFQVAFILVKGGGGVSCCMHRNVLHCSHCNFVPHSQTKLFNGKRNFHMVDLCLNRTLMSNCVRILFTTRQPCFSLDIHETTQKSSDFGIRFVQLALHCHLNVFRCTTTPKLVGEL